MSGKELLYSLFDINAEIRKKIDMLDEMRANAIGITASTDKESIQTSGDKDRIGNIVAKIADLENEINALTDGYIERKKIAKHHIFSIDNEKYQNILYDYFIVQISLYQIAENYDMKYDHCKKVKNRAIKVFEKHFNAKSSCD